MRAALDAGYRMIDRATGYENGRDVGRAVRESGMGREEICVVSKRWPLSDADPDKGIQFSMRELDIGYIDLYLLHWPHRDSGLRYRAWEALLAACQKGDFHSVGVSNFMAAQLKDLIGKFPTVPARAPITI